MNVYPKQLEIKGSISEGSAKLIIPTLEGDMKASLGDYIIKGVQGEFYPCKPEIFEATYEEVYSTSEELVFEKCKPEVGGQYWLDDNKEEYGTVTKIDGKVTWFAAKSKHYEGDENGLIPLSFDTYYPVY